MAVAKHMHENLGMYDVCTKFKPALLQGATSRGTSMYVIQMLLLIIALNACCSTVYPFFPYLRSWKQSGVFRLCARYT